MDQPTDEGVGMEQHEQLEVMPPPHCAFGITEMEHKKGGGDQLPSGNLRPSEVIVHQNCPELKTLPLPATKVGRVVPFHFCAIRGF